MLEIAFLVSDLFGLFALYVPFVCNSDVSPAVPVSDAGKVVMMVRKTRV